MKNEIKLGPGNTALLANPLLIKHTRTNYCKNSPEAKALTLCRDTAQAVKALNDGAKDAIKIRDSIRDSFPTGGEVIAIDGVPVATIGKGHSVNKLDEAKLGAVRDHHSNQGQTRKGLPLFSVRI